MPKAFAKKQFVQGYWRRKARPAMPRYVVETESGEYWDPAMSCLTRKPPTSLMFLRGAERTACDLDLSGNRAYVYKVV